MGDGEDLTTLPSQEFREQLEKTQATGTEAISDPVDAEEGLKKVQDDLQDFSEEDTEVVIIAQGQENQIQETDKQIVTKEE
ncbi:hypothetical protein IGI04_030605 [Brassica rapa subsp. trilocularis]|uniref:BnaAnng11190D protein n=2 Tax=Brassica TaxID=3705 RepID=A0A078IT01_BRANA|nr:hypothetical protein IGI04_030605 [Brassica rapa subsp. trilocularis]CDY52178.1 BnaAnng11190D [Brassica napus]